MAGSGLVGGAKRRPKAMRKPRAKKAAHKKVTVKQVQSMLASIALEPKKKAAHKPRAPRATVKHVAPVAVLARHVEDLKRKLNEAERQLAYSIEYHQGVTSRAAPLVSHLQKAEHDVLKAEKALESAHTPLQVVKAEEKLAKAEEKLAVAEEQVASEEYLSEMHPVEEGHGLFRRRRGHAALRAHAKKVKAKKAKAKAKKSASPWISYVKAFRAANPCMSYKQALQAASASYGTCAI